MATQAPSGTTRNGKRVKNIDLSRYLDLPKPMKLTDRQYECSSLKWEYGLSGSEIARELKVHRKTVDDHLRLAQAKMRASGQYYKLRKRLAQVRPGE
jgi:DNA-binding CsgD family transcriptional regulator